MTIVTTTAQVSEVQHAYADEELHRQDHRTR